MREWIDGKLEDVCHVYQPQTLSQKSLVAGPYPVYGANGQIGWHAEFNHEDPQLLLGCRGSCGFVNFSHSKSWVNGNAMVVQPIAGKIDVNFLAYALRGGIDISKAITGAAQPQITRTSLMPLPITYPKDITEQHRIVDLLSRAEGILCLRREAKAKCADLIPALFLNMFGDPASNPSGWPMVAFGELGQLDRGKSRHRPRDAQELYGGPYPFIQTGDVTISGGTITRYGQTYSELGLAQSRLWPAGTLCITIAANIARTGVLGFDACFPDSVVGFTPSGKVLIPYIQQWLGFLQPTLEANAPQAAQKNINLDILRNLPVPLPPIALQRRFATKSDAFRSISAQQDSALAIAQATFDALLSKAFKH